MVACPVKVVFVYAGCVATGKKREAICSTVARLLKEERERQGLSLNSLAARAGLSRQMVSYIEQEERNPTLDTLLRLADALNIELDEILKRARLKAPCG
jgi:transcriptional regulator with XRE-family HTH domain